MTVFRGFPAAPGRARGLATSVDLASERGMEGAILVARVVHPYLAPLLFGCHGLVVEDGGLLQHAVILAREFEIPAVVGVRGAVERFSPGTPLLVDGTAGLVEIARATAGEG